MSDARYNEKLVCKKCNHTYTRSNKQKHLNSNLHKKNTNDKQELELYLEERKSKYDAKINKLLKERDIALHKINKQIINI